VGKRRAFYVFNPEVHEITAGLQRFMSRGQGFLLGDFEWYSCVYPNNGTSIIGFNIECTGNWKEQWWWWWWWEDDEILPFILPGSQIINRHQHHNQ
jgi:hypothetical protein